MRARQAAALLLSTLDRGEAVPRFLDLYSAEYRRPGRADQPVYYREQTQTIRREAILSIVSRIEEALPAKLKVSVTLHSSKKVAKGKKKRPGRKQSRPQPRRPASLELAIPFLDLFREEFFVALGQYLEWTQEDAEQFWRDLELYEKLKQKQGRRTIGRSEGIKGYGPFADRVAMLLDPSLMEQARRAAAKFKIELDSSADRILRQAFSKRPI